MDKNAKNTLLQVAQDLRKLVTSINALVTVAKDLGTLASSVSLFLDALIAEPPYEQLAMPASPEPVKIEAALEDPEKKRAALILEARAILGTKVTAEAQELIRSFGVQNLSKVELADFDELIARAKELTDASK